MSRGRQGIRCASGCRAGHGRMDRVGKMRKNSADHGRLAQEIQRAGTLRGARCSDYLGGHRSRRLPVWRSGHCLAL